MTGYNDKDTYCGVTNVDNTKKVFLFGHNNNLEATGADVGKFLSTGLHEEYDIHHGRTWKDNPFFVMTKALIIQQNYPPIKKITAIFFGI